MDYSKIKIYKVSKPVEPEPLKKIEPKAEVVEKLTPVRRSAEKTDLDKKRLALKNQECKWSNELVSLTMEEELKKYEIGLDEKWTKAELKAQKARIEQEYAQKRKLIQDKIWKSKAERKDIWAEMQFIDANARKRTDEEKNNGMRKLKEFVISANPAKMVMQRTSIKVQIMKINRVLREGKRSHAPFTELNEEDKIHYKAILLEYNKQLQAVEEALKKEMV